MQQKLTALEDVPKTTQPEQVKNFPYIQIFLYVTALQSVFLLEYFPIPQIFFFK